MTQPPQPPRQSAEGFVADREQWARIIDEEAWRSFDEELHTLEHEIEAAGLTTNQWSLSWLALDNVNSRRTRRAASLIKANALITLAAPPPPTQEQELATFRDRLRALLHIDFDQLIDAGVMAETDHVDWHRFMNDPWRWFIRASGEDAAKVWAIMEKPR